MSERWVIYAAVLLLQLNSYATPSETNQPKRKDVRCNQAHATKTGTQDDSVLLDSIDREYAPKLLGCVCAVLRGLEERFFSWLVFSRHEAATRRAKRSAGLAAFQQTRHTVRHAGQ